jgi:hypothetical protein
VVLAAAVLALRALLLQLQPVRMVVLDQLTRFQEHLSIMPVVVAAAQQDQQPEGQEALEAQALAATVDRFLLGRE